MNADGEGRLAVYGVGSPEYEQLAAGHLPGQDSPVKVLPAMRSRR